MSFGENKVILIIFLEIVYFYILKNPQTVNIFGKTINQSIYLLWLWTYEKVENF